jgi:hypothetical protein
MRSMLYTLERMVKLVYNNIVACGGLTSVRVGDCAPA